MKMKEVVMHKDILKHMKQIRKSRIAIKQAVKNADLNLAENVKRIREELEMTQDDLSELAGISRPQIANIEGGRSNASLGILITLSLALSSTPDELLGFRK